VSYLIGQPRAGADAAQIFDTSAGVLPTGQFERWCIVISFSPGAGAALKRYGACVPQDPVLIGLLRRIDSLYPTAVRAAAGKLGDRAPHLADVIPQLFFRLPTA
jgi:uroporphyrinogen decarboxylase